jgi:hypothetical protein
VRKGAQVCVGVLLFILSVFGLSYACRTACAQVLYHEAKFGLPAADARQVLDLCERSWRLYPHGYYLAIWAAETAYRNRFSSGGVENPARVEQTRVWCERGLALNPYDSQLRDLKTQLLARDSAVAAARYWGEYVEWSFWDPWNHARLAELHAAAGDYERALESLDWAKGSEYHAAARDRVLSAWRREREQATTPAGTRPARLPQ